MVRYRKAGVDDLDLKDIALTEETMQSDID